MTGKDELKWRVCSSSFSAFRASPCAPCVVQLQEARRSQKKRKGLRGLFLRPKKILWAKDLSHSFVSSSTKANVDYYKCSTGKNECNGRGFVWDDRFYLTHRHNHAEKAKGLEVRQKIRETKSAATKYPSTSTGDLVWQS